MRRVTDSRADDVALNRALWAVVNERFTDAAADELWARPDAVWGLFAIPEGELGVLGDVRGLDVLELACGTAYAAWLAPGGPGPWRSTSPASSWRRPAGCSAGSARCSRSAVRRRAAAAGRRLVDLVVSEHGAAAWCDPERWLPEVARLLRPGGRLVSSPTATWRRASRPTRGWPRRRLLRGVRARLPRAVGRGRGCEFHPSHGDWVRLLRRSGFVVGAARALRAGRPHGPPFYEIVSPHWASRWPAEELWVARRAERACPAEALAVAAQAAVVRVSATLVGPVPATRR